jgi:threonine synthase
VTIATAHPAKFAAAVVEATGLTPELPSDLADLEDRAERIVSLPNDYRALIEFLQSR